MLLGSVLVSEIGGRTVRCRITEVEAYGGVGEDPGSHAHRGRTPRNDAMFLGPGHLYCYFTYGMHWCANVVTGPEGSASGILLRAGEIIDGAEVAFERRRTSGRARELARGPARLAKALGIDGSCDGLDLLASSAVRLEPGTAPVEIGVSPRTGVSGAGAQTPWRFFAMGEPTVSPYRRAHARRSG